MKEIIRITGKTTIRVSWMLLRIYIPLSILTVLLKLSGFFEWLGPALAPVMHWMGLPGETAVTLVAGYLGSVYGALATMSAIGLTFRQVTILAVVIGISHNLIVETGILMKLKFADLRIPFFRIIMGIVTGILLNLFLPHEVPGAILNPYANPEAFSWVNTLKGMGITIAQILTLIFLLNLLYEILKRWSFSKRVKVVMQRLAPYAGIGHAALVPWLVGFFFGIVYGAGILFQFAEKKALSSKDVPLVTLFVVLAHAIIEDTLIFVVVGGNFWYIFLIRIALAFVAMKLFSIGNNYRLLRYAGFRTTQ